VHLLAWDILDLGILEWALLVWALLVWALLALLLGRAVPDHQRHFGFLHSEAEFQFQVVATCGSSGWN